MFRWITGSNSTNNWKTRAPQTSAPPILRACGVELCLPVEHRLIAPRTSPGAPTLRITSYCQQACELPLSFDWTSMKTAPIRHNQRPGGSHHRISLIDARRFTLNRTVAARTRSHQIADKKHCNVRLADSAENRQNRLPYATDRAAAPPVVRDGGAHRVEIRGQDSFTRRRFFHLGDDGRGARRVKVPALEPMRFGLRLPLFHGEERRQAPASCHRQYGPECLGLLPLRRFSNGIRCAPASATGSLKQRNLL
jgi:hypothetical protein